jgi:hypothetical protein
MAKTQGIVDVEELELPATYSQHYAITITLKPKWYKINASNQLARTATYILQALVSMGRFSITYELTPQGNIHYHGVIEFSQMWYMNKHPIMRWHNYWRRDEYVGFTCIKVMTDGEGWKKYVMKDVHRTNELLAGAFKYTNPIRDKHQLVDYLPVHLD